MKYNCFHATLADMTPRLQKIEAQFKLKYIPIGWQKSATGEIYTSVFDIPDMGKSKFGHFSLNDGFLVCPAETDFVIRAVPQDAGGIWYLVDMDVNPGAFGFSPGGMYEPNLLIGGYIWPNTIDPAVRKLCFKFSHLLLKGFEAVQDWDHYPWWVGPEAMHLLKSDWVLRTSGYWPLALPVEKHIELDGMAVRIRQERTSEAINQVLKAAFQRSNEVELVEALAHNGHLHLSLIAEIEGQIVGYIAFSPVNIKKGNHTYYFAQGLGPLAVLPEYQGKGIGSALVRIGLDATFKQGKHIIVVLGAPAFYSRFGFEKSAKYDILWEHEAPEEEFQVIGRNADTLKNISGVVTYMPEFENV